MQRVVNIVRNLWSSRYGRKFEQSVLDSLSEGIIITDKTGKFLFFNSVAKRSSGLVRKKSNRLNGLLSMDAIIRIRSPHTRQTASACAGDKRNNYHG